MRRKKNIKRFLTRISDFILGFVIAMIVITLGRYAMADALDSIVNSKIKEEFFKMDLDQRRAALEFGRSGNLDQTKGEDGALAHEPVGQADPLIHHSDGISAAEQAPEFGRPRTGVTNRVDPADAIENQLADEQAYQLYREHYRGVIRDDIIRRAKEAGINIPSSDLPKN